MDELLEEYVDVITKTINYDDWKLGFNKETAEEPEFVDSAREEIKEILYEFYKRMRANDN